MMLKLNKFAGWALLILFILAAFVMVAEPYTTAGFVEPISVLILMVGLFFGLRWIYRKILQLSKQRLKVLVLGLFALSVVIQIIWVNIAHLQLFGDPWHILTQATRLMQGDKTWDIWNQQYPNLLPLIALNMVFIKIANFLHVSFYAIFYTFNILITSSVWAVIVRFLWKKKPHLAAFAMVLLLMMPMVNSFLLYVGYSDGIALLSLALLLCIFDRPKFGLLAFVETSLLFTIAYLARPNVIILLIALLIIGIFAYANRKKYGKLYQSAGKMLLACLLGIILATGATQVLAKSLNYNLKSTSVLPTIHWIYMGLNLPKSGEYNAVDRDYSLYHVGYPTASAADKAGIVQRLESDNVKLPFLWLAKFGTLWSSGTFTTTMDYQAFNWTYDWTQASGFLVQNIGAINIFWETYAKALVGLMLLAIAYHLWKKKPDLVTSYGLMLFTIMGISLFHSLIWEVKPRYQFMTFSFLILAAVFSFPTLFEESTEKVTQARQRLKLALPFASVLSLILMATVMQLQPQQRVVVNAQQHPTDNYGYSKDDLHLMPGQTISQEFNLPVAANQIELQTGTSAPLQLEIQKKVSGNWLNQGNFTLDLPLPNAPASYQTQILNPKLAAGDYRFSVTNPNKQSASMEAILDPSNLDYPHLIQLPNGRTASFAFIISQTKRVTRFPLALILGFGLLFILVNLLLLLV